MVTVLPMSKGSLHFGHGACGGARRPPRRSDAASFLQLNHRWMHERWYTWPQFTSACGRERGWRVVGTTSVRRGVKHSPGSACRKSRLGGLARRANRDRCSSSSRGRTRGTRPTDVAHLESRVPSVRRERTTLFSPVDSMHTQHCDIVADAARGGDDARTPPAGHPGRAPPCDALVRSGSSDAPPVKKRRAHDS